MLIYVTETFTLQVPFQGEQAKRSQQGKILSSGFFKNKYHIFLLTLISLSLCMCVYVHVWVGLLIPSSNFLYPISVKLNIKGEFSKVGNFYQRCESKWKRESL